MNLASQSGEAGAGQLLFANFNQDNTNDLIAILKRHAWNLDLSLCWGTVIRVFSIPEGQKLFEFRRGVKRCVSISSLAFSMDGMFLSASSNTETVHIFKLETVKEKPQEEPTTWTGYFGKVLMVSTNYLPAQVTEMFNQGRAFATVRLPFCGHKNICALATIQKIPRLLVGAADGYLYMYNLDPQEGGECTLMKQHK
uniref:WD repeat domain phosphoinositide-interacting protein 2 n=1 Tax=Sphaerodactylus townsendi TaxID=933632 RepID=A0ACB8FL67_9SAUR